MSFDIAAAVGTCTLNEDTETTTFGAFFALEGGRTLYYRAGRRVYIWVRSSHYTVLPFDEDCKIIKMAKKFEQTSSDW
jgi:hypothetical protein